MKLARLALLLSLAAAAWGQVNVGEQQPEPTLPFKMTEVSTFGLPWRIAFLPENIRAKQRAGTILVQRCEIQAVLVTKRVIKAAAINAHAIDKVLNGRRLIAFRPKGLDRALERIVEIEFAGPSHLRCL